MYIVWSGLQCWYFAQNTRRFFKWTMLWLKYIWAAYKIWGFYTVFNRFILLILLEKSQNTRSISSGSRPDSKNGWLPSCHIFVLMQCSAFVCLVSSNTCISHVINRPDCLLCLAPHVAVPSQQMVESSIDHIMSKNFISLTVTLKCCNIAPYS